MSFNASQKIDILTFLKQKHALPVLVFLTLINIIALQILNTPLKTAAAPAGIVSFELAGQLQQSLIILDSWQGKIATIAAPYP
ncbi:MAG TPA: hypothetical protein ENJ60_00125 [Aeromonadales bacterium]|nr:hypothetical protein [Aeromonadales bacterium]